MIPDVGHRDEEKDAWARDRLALLDVEIYVDASPLVMALSREGGAGHSKGWLIGSSRVACSSRLRIAPSVMGWARLWRGLKPNPRWTEYCTVSPGPAGSGRIQYMALVDRKGMPTGKSARCSYCTSSKKQHRVSV